MFFSEEKNQKTFAHAPAESLAHTSQIRDCTKKNKSLLVLFFRKERLPYTRRLCGRAIPLRDFAMWERIEGGGHERQFGEAAGGHFTHQAGAVHFYRHLGNA